MKTKTMEREYFIEKNQEGKYLFVPFECPKNVWRMEISYSYKRFVKQETNQGIVNQEVNIVDLGLHDEKNAFRGASGSNKTEIFIEENTSTPGYISGIIHPGTWRLMFGAYKVEEVGCIVKFKIVFHFKERLLLRGDLHMHTQISDGDYSPRELINLAHMMKLDYIFLTDHNNFHQNDFIVPNEPLAVLPGMELTLYNGHCNLLGVKRPVTSFFANSKEELKKTLLEARKNGALISINHPYDDCPWLFGFDLPFDLLEIQNSFYEEHIDRQTINFWQERLVKGCRLPIVGGSDNHRIAFMQSLGTPTTCLYAQSRGKSDILMAVRNGHAFVSMFLDGPVVALEMNGFIMGDIVPKEKITTLSITIQSLKRQDEIKVIANTGEIFSKINDSGVNETQFTIEPNDATFYRVEIWRFVAPNVKILGAITNPIYIGEDYWRKQEND